MSKQKLISLIIAGIASTIALLIISFFIFMNLMFSGRHIDNIPFDAVEWRRVGESEIRQEMVDDFLQNHNPVGSTRQDLIALLGEQSKTHHFQEYDLIYWVGFERGFGVDSEWLVLKLDDQNVVTEARLVTD